MLMIISGMRMVLKIIMIIHGHIDDTDEDFKTTRISSESKNQPPASLYSSHVHDDDCYDHQDDMIT